MNQEQNRFNITIKEIRIMNLKLLLAETGFSQDKFAKEINTSPSYISQMCSKFTKRNMGDQIARKIEITFHKPRGWMDTLQEPEAYKMKNTPPKPELDFPENNYFTIMEKCYSSENLNEIDVGLSILTNSNCPDYLKTHTLEKTEILLRISKKMLFHLGIAAKNAFGYIVKGNNMQPLLPEGTVLAINSQDTDIKDGEIYLIYDSGQLRINMVYHQIGGVIRLHSFNHRECPDELIHPEQRQLTTIIGRVFCWSVLR